MRNTKEEVGLYISDKAKRREALAYIDEKVKEEGGNRNSRIWDYIIKCVEEEKNDSRNNN